MTRTKANLDVREKAKVAGVYLWQIAAEMGVSEPTFNRWLRTEMPAKKKEQVKQVINRLNEKQNGGTAV